MTKKSIELTDAELQDLMWTYRPDRWAADVIEPVTDFSLDEWQRTFLRDDRKRLLLLVHRQGGKSTAVGIKALHRALFRDNQTVVLVSPTQRQSSDLLRTIRRMVKAIPEYACKLVVDNVMSMELANGSRILSLPATNWNIRGTTANLVIIDEAAGVPDEIYAAVSPMLLTTQGQFILVSTPKAKTGNFYAAYIGQLWSKYIIRASENPRMQTPEMQAFLQDELVEHGSRIYGQEYECEFLDDLDVGRIKRSWWQFYDVDDIRSLREQSSDIYISWDTAQKVKEISDYSVGTVWLRIQDDYYLLEMVCEKLLFPELVRTAIDLNNRYRPTYNLIEDKSSGVSLIQELREKRPNMPIKPIDPGSMDKGQRLDMATPAIEAGRVHLPATVIQDGGNTVMVPTSTAGAVMDNLAQFPEGEHDDITDSVSQFLVYIREHSRMPHIEFL